MVRVSLHQQGIIQVGFQLLIVFCQLDSIFHSLLLILCQFHVLQRGRGFRIRAFRPLHPPIPAQKHGTRCRTQHNPLPLPANPAQQIHQVNFYLICPFPGLLLIHFCIFLSSNPVSPFQLHLLYVFPFQRHPFLYTMTCSFYK